MKEKSPLSVEELLALRAPAAVAPKFRNVKMGRLDRLAVFITDHVGTMGFFLLIFSWTTVWLLWNFLAPAHLKFDPPMSFVFYLFISNVIQICLMPLIMVGQNLQNRHADLRADLDLRTNLQAEREIEALLLHTEAQNKMLIAMVEKLGLDVRDVLKQVE